VLADIDPDLAAAEQRSANVFPERRVELYGALTNRSVPAR